MWLLAGYSFLSAIAYFAMWSVLTIWLSDDLGLGDEASGYIITLLGMTMAFALLVFCALIHTMGVKRVLVISTCLLLIAQASMIWVTNTSLIWVLITLPLSLGLGLGNNVVQIAVKWFSRPTTLALGLAVVAVTIKVASVVADGVIVFSEMVFTSVAPMGAKYIYVYGMRFSQYQLLFVTTASDYGWIS